MAMFPNSDLHIFIPFSIYISQHSPALVGDFYAVAVYKDGPYPHLARNRLVKFLDQAHPFLDEKMLTGMRNWSQLQSGCVSHTESLLENI